MAACSPILRGDCLSALGRAWWEESGPGDAGGGGAGGNRAPKNDPSPLRRGRGLPPTSSTKRGYFSRRPGWLGWPARGRIDAHSINLTAPRSL